MQQTMIFIDGWEIRPDRLRPIDPDAVDRLAKSMGDIGLLTPITVYLNGGDPVLVSGAHRVLAAQKLGWHEIDAFVMDGDEIDRKMWEIAENLHRLDLTKAQRDEHIRQYADLLRAREAREIQATQNASPEIGYGKPPPQKKGIVRQVADATGLSHDTVNRALNPKPPAEREPAQHMDKTEQDYLRLVNAWKMAGQVARTRFMRWVDENV